MSGVTMCEVGSKEKIAENKPRKKKRVINCEKNLTMMNPI